MIRELHGLEPERLSSSTLRFHKGSVCDTVGVNFLEFTSAFDLDTSLNGSGGMAYCGFNYGADYFPYVIKNIVTEEFGITLSDEISITNVILPSDDWVVFRKLPWGFCAVNGAYIEGGKSGVAEIPTFHISAWPKPITTLTQHTTESNFSKVLSNGTNVEFTAFPCTKLVPDNARMVEFMLVVTGGDVLVRSGAFQGNGVRFCIGQHNMRMRVDSLRNLFYKSLGGSITAYISGYHNTEPS